MTKNDETSQVLSNFSDSDLPDMLRTTVAKVNLLSEHAAKRDLHVRYDIKPGQKNDGLTNPRIIVSVMTEVI